MLRPLCSFSLSGALAMLLLSSVQADEVAKVPWAKDMAAFAARDAKAPPPADCLLFTGSSSVRLWKLEESWPGLPTVNNGFGGSTLHDLIEHFEETIAPYDPAAIVIYSGDNDIKSGKTVMQVATDFETVARLIRTKKPDVPVIFIAIKPSISRWTLWPQMKQANDAIAAFCRENSGFFFADIATAMITDTATPPSAELFARDGLHLSPAGYVLWTKEVNDQLDKAGVPH
jgi:lysophospholipase L1-like esterase